MNHGMTGWGICAALALSGCGGEQRDVTAPADQAETSSASDGATTAVASAEPAEAEAGVPVGDGPDGGDAGKATSPAQPTVPLLTPDLIRDVVRPRYQDIATCYQEGLTRDPELAGTVEVALTIAGDGSVIDARQKDVPPGKRNKPARHVDDPITDAEVVRCVLTKFKAFRFPASRRGMTNTVYPIVFATE